MPPLGGYLGELTSELDDDDHIVTFVLGGPRNYAYQTKNGKTVCKVRGFTLNHRGSKKINFDTKCEQVNPSLWKYQTLSSVIRRQKHCIVYSLKRNTI